MSDQTSNNLYSQNILIIGGGGYVGSVLTQELLLRGHNISVIDNFWFGNDLVEHPKLKIYKNDIREFNQKVFAENKFNTVIHLANVANDPAVELNQIMSWEINVLAGKTIIEFAIANGAQKFIFASSGSVYGVSESPNVTENHPLVPISAYNKTKMIAERVFASYIDLIKLYVIRPATVCGLSPRMRLDVSVNMLSFQALKNRKITVFGGSQVRPNIHIDDLVEIYKIIAETDKIETGIYNAGFENLSIMEIAETIQNKIDCEIVVEPTNDIRSYRQDSSKLINQGFKPIKSVKNAIDELKESYESGILTDNDRFYTVRWMKLKNYN